MRVWLRQAWYLQRREGGNLILLILYNYCKTTLEVSFIVNTDIFHKMPTKLFMLCSLIFSTCQGLQFNVSRVTKVSNSGSIDLFTNLDPSAKCPNEKPNLDAGKLWCTERKAYCSSQGCCVCECQYSDATFQLKMNPYNASCVGNKDIRTFAGRLKIINIDILHFAINIS